MTKSSINVIWILCYLSDNFAINKLQLSKGVIYAHQLVNSFNVQITSGVQMRMKSRTNCLDRSHEDRSRMKNSRFWSLLFFYRYTR